MPEAADDSEDKLSKQPAYAATAVGTEQTAKKRSTNAGTAAATARAFIAFYFRAPAKAFFRTRFDYTGVARDINPYIKANEPWSWRMTTPGLLAHAVKEHGWRFIPNQVLPPMLANTTVGAILYTTYLQTLSSFHEPASRQSKRIYPPPPISATFSAGFVAGSVQSLAAAPLDALQVRFNTADMLEGTYQNIWQYAGHKLKEIGPRGVFAGYSLSFIKDSFGFAVFFSTFEAIKSTAYYSFVRWWYDESRPIFLEPVPLPDSSKNAAEHSVARPHFAIEPTFLFAAGVGASIAQQTIQHPLNSIQNVHYGRLESLDYAAKATHNKSGIFRLYYKAYEETYKQCKILARGAGGWRRWMYKDLIWTTVRQTPSTTAGLMIFELVRRRYDADEFVFDQSLLPSWTS